MQIQHCPIQKFKWLFDTVQPQPLTQEQCQACVSDASRQLLVAAAGSGKTSTMVAKVAYSLASGILKPEQILVLAFNVAAAKELSQRISHSLHSALGINIKIKTSTLHALGLQIVSSVNKNIQVLHDEKDKNKVLKNVIDITCKSDADFADNCLLFAVFYHAVVCHPNKSLSKLQWRLFVKRYGYQSSGLYGFLTIKGELVFTQFEQAVANWLNSHDIKYQYRYSIKTRLSKYILPNAKYGCLNGAAYFLLPEHKLRLYCVTDLTDKWCKKFKRINNKNYILLSLKQFIAARLFKRLSKILSLLGVYPKPVDLNRLLFEHALTNQDSFLNPYQLDFLQQFINSARLAVTDGFMQSTTALSIQDSTRQYLHAPMLKKLISVYADYLAQHNLTDFSGMLSQAAVYVNQDRYKSSYSLILVDEFQDTSAASVSLLQALLNKSKDSKLFAVGDDWQSIYGFAGALPDVMLNFDKYFGVKYKLNNQIGKHKHKHKHIVQVNHLTNTFRFNQHIADTASRFIQANPNQIKKQVKAHIPSDPHSIKLRICTSISSMYASCYQCLIDINNALVLKPSKNRFRVYILARYRHQIPPQLEIWQQSFNCLEICFSTIHAAKGMQAQAVIILGLYMGKYGFPSQIKSDALFKLVNTSQDDFLYAQERRLFYVALTRTKGDVYLLAGRCNPSPFIAEIASDILPENVI